MTLPMLTKLVNPYDARGGSGGNGPDEEVRSWFDKKVNDQPKRSYLWAIYLPDLANNMSGSLPNQRHSSSASIGEANSQFESIKSRFELDSLDSEEKLNFRVTSVSVPFFSFETESASLRNSRFTYATTQTTGDINLDIIDTEDSAALRYFWAWSKMIHNENGTYNPPAFYKKQIEFRQYDRAKRKLTSYKYDGFFPTEITDLSVDYESNDLAVLSVVLTGDLMYPSFYQEFTINFDNAESIGLKEKEIEKYVFKQDDMENIQEQNLFKEISSFNNNTPLIPGTGNPFQNIDTSMPIP